MLSVHSRGFSLSCSPELVSMSARVQYMFSLLVHALARQALKDFARYMCVYIYKHVYTDSQIGTVDGRVPYCKSKLKHTAKPYSNSWGSHIATFRASPGRDPHCSSHWRPGQGRRLGSRLKSWYGHRCLNGCCCCHCRCFGVQHYEYVSEVP